MGRALDLTLHLAASREPLAPGLPLALTLAPLPQGAPTDHGILVHIDHLAPRRLMRVELLVDGLCVFNLHEARDARGFIVPAGVMLAAITTMSGREGLVIEQRLESACPRSILLRLWLDEPAAGARVVARVEAWR